MQVEHRSVVDVTVGQGFVVLQGCFFAAVGSLKVSVVVW